MRSKPSQTPGPSEHSGGGAIIQNPSWVEHGNGLQCLILKKVDSQKRVNNVSITHGKTAPVL